MLSNSTVNLWGVSNSFQLIHYKFLKGYSFIINGNTALLFINKSVRVRVCVWSTCCSTTKFVTTKYSLCSTIGCLVLGILFVRRFDCMMGWGGWGVADP